MPSSSVGPEFPPVSKLPHDAFPSDIWAPCAHRKLFSAITDYVNARSVPQNFSKHMVYFLLLDAPESEDMRRFMEAQNAVNHIDKDFVAGALEERVRGKTIVELGCRSACFLRLLKDLGAKAVYGVTDRSYAVEARREIGKENVVINYTTDLSLDSTVFLARQKPDIVLNVGLLDWDRGNAGPEAKQKLFRVLHKLGGMNYVIGSVNGRSELTQKDFWFSRDKPEDFSKRECELLDWRGKKISRPVYDFHVCLPPRVRGKFFNFEEAPNVLGFRFTHTLK